MEVNKSNEAVVNNSSEASQLFKVISVNGKEYNILDKADVLPLSIRDSLRLPNESKLVLMSLVYLAICKESPLNEYYERNGFMCANHSLIRNTLLGGLISESALRRSIKSLDNYYDFIDYAPEFRNRDGEYVDPMFILKFNRISDFSEDNWYKQINKNTLHKLEYNAR